MLSLSKLRLPYRDDAAFSLLAFCLFLLPLVFSLYSYENFESLKFSLFLIMTGASGMVFSLKQATSGKGIKYNKYFYWLAGLFGIWAILSAILSQDKIYAIFGFYYRYTSGLIFYAALLTFIFLLVNLLDREKLIFLLKILILDAIAVALVTYLQSFGWIFYGGLDTGGIFRGPSLLGNSNYSAMFLACIFPLVLYFLSQSRSRSSKVYYFTVSFFIIFAELLLASRGALLSIVCSLVIALGLLVVFRFPKKFILGLLVFAAACIVFGYFFLNVSRPQAIASVASGVDQNAITRFYAWKVSVSGIVQHPLFGVGPGNYALFFEHGRFPEVANQIGVFDDAHNLFLQLAVTGGLPLALLFFSLILLAVGLGLAELKREKNLLTTALISSLAAWVVSTSFNPVPVPMYALLAVLLVGLCFNQFNNLQTNFVFWKKFIFVFFAAVLVIVGLISLVSEHLLGLARDAYSAENYGHAAGLSSLAYSINPTNGQFLIYKASSAIYLNKPKAAIESDIEKIVKLHPTQAGSFVSASSLYSLLYRQRSQKEDLTSAIAAMDSAIKIDPLYGARYGQLALYYYQLQNFAQAEINIERDLALDKGDFSAWILLARLYQLQGNKESTIAALTKAFKLNPNIRQLKYLLYLAKNLPNIQQVPIEVVPRQPGV